MSYKEQKKFLAELKKNEFRMNPKDSDTFKMFMKRDKDEEEFDTVSFARLRELYDKYITNRPKPSAEDLFRKYSGNK